MTHLETTADRCRVEIRCTICQGPVEPPSAPEWAAFGGATEETPICLDCLITEALADGQEDI